MTTLDSRQATASKPHRCDQCGGLIGIGQRYHKDVGAWDGFQVHRAHMECDRAALDYHDIYDLQPDEGVRLADDLERWDSAWMAARHPAAAMRLHLVLTPYF
jgi:hypothetical protein